MDLEALIHDEPDSADVFLVYADSLQRQGAPLGDLMSTHYALSQATDHDRLVSLRARYEAILTEHPELLPAVLRQELDLGILFGLVRNAWIYRSGNESQIGAASVQLEALLAAPSARFLTSLHLEISDEAQPDPYSVFARAPKLHSLRRLRLNDLRHPIHRRGELLDPLLQSTPRLQALQLRGQCPHLGSLAHQGLTHLEIATHHMSIAVLTALIESKLPSLHTLVLHLNPPPGDSTEYQQSVIQLISNLNAPKLRRLAIHQTPFSNLICQQLQYCELLEQLEVLDLTGGSLTDDGARAILAQPSRYQHLATLALGENWLEQTQAGLRGLGDFVEMGTQRNWARSRRP